MKYSTKYLYDRNPSDFMYEPYAVALRMKIHSARALMKRLSIEAESVINDPVIYRPILERYMAAERAIKFNQELLDELSISSDLVE